MFFISDTLFGTVSIFNDIFMCDVDTNTKVRGKGAEAA